jgi:hypothetical protein
MHARIRTTRTIVACDKARSIINKMFNDVYDVTVNLENMGVKGLSDVLDKCIEDMRMELDIIQTAARAEQTVLQEPGKVEAA